MRSRRSEPLHCTASSSLHVGGDGGGGDGGGFAQEPQGLAGMQVHGSKQVELSRTHLNCFSHTGSQHELLLPSDEYVLLHEKLSSSRSASTPNFFCDWQ